MSLPEPTLFDPNDEETEFSNLDKLQAVHPELHETPEENQETSTSSQASSVIETNNRNQNQIDPGDIVLIQNLGPNNPELAPYGTGLPDGSSPEVLTDDHREMTNQVEAQGVKLEPNGQDVHPTAVVSKQPLKDGVEASDCLSQAAVNNQDLAEQAKRVLQLESTSNEHNYDQQTGPSALMSIKENRNGQLQADIRTRSGRVSPAPLKLHTKPTNTQQEDTIATSPRLCKHVITAPRQAEGTLPALQHSPTKDGTASSPQTEKLPSFRQLSELAAVATQQDPLVYHQHRQSFGSASAQSPGIPYLYAQGSAHTSPSTQYVHSARSPSSAIHEHHYNSPTNIPPQSYYGDRRSSVVTDTATPFPPASLPSASSSGDSAGHTSSSTDGYSTAHTTPTDSASGVENNQRPILPPPHGIPPNPVMIQNGYRCDHPGCTAVPFQTQYLLRCV